MNGNHLALIPARCGSKGLPDKNIKVLLGKPLIAYSIECAIKSGLFAEVMVSTDSKVYADIACTYGATVPFLRSPELSTDTAGSWDVVREVLNEYEHHGKRFDTVCLLQPTSPMRVPSDIIAGYEEYYDKNADAITSVCEVDHSPIWTMTLDESKSLSEFRLQIGSLERRQLSPKYYRINGALYIRRIEYFDHEASIVSNREYAHIMPVERSVDIDSSIDFEYAEFLMSKAFSNTGEHDE